MSSIGEETNGESETESETESGTLAGPPEGSAATGAAEGAVNFDDAALVELELDGTDYRMDSGRAGTAFCISTRPSGTWSWTFRGEARWQANVLRCKAFDRSVLTRLSQALVEVSSASD